MYENQNGLDPITMLPLDGDRICVDHCHKTGKVRGLLSSVTNTALGQLLDDPDVLQRAAEYLRNDGFCGFESTEQPLDEHSVPQEGDEDGSGQPGGPSRPVGDVQP